MIVMPEEMLDVVDENDKVTGRDTRKNVHNKGFWHRGIHVIILNRKGEMLLQLRSPGKEQYPNAYDLSVSEHVGSGESYWKAVRRGLREELGITGARPEKLLHFRMNYGNPGDNMVGVIYELRFDGKLKIDKREIQAVKFTGTDRIKKMVRDGKEKKKFSYWTYEILRWYFRMPSRVEKIG